MSQHRGIILPISYFPPVSYFICIASGLEILIETGETFPKQTLRNRCEIGDSSGKQILVVPVHKPHGNHSRTHEVSISYHGDWQKKHWRALETAYASTPFFLYYSDPVRELIFGSYSTLEEMNLALLNHINEMLQIKGRHDVNHDYKKDATEWIDLRGAFSKRRTWEEPFGEYSQVFSHINGFFPDLSILDLLFNLGPEAPAYLERNSGIIPISS